MRASRQGVVDFRQANVLDPGWWRRVNALVGDLARDDDLEILKAAYEFHLALLSNPQLTEDSWKATKKTAAELFNEIVNISQPWGARSTEQRRDEEMTRLRDLYVDVIGDPDDPDFRAALQAEVERLREPAPDEEESQEELVDRRFLERLREERRRRDG